jgi:hypothetical protein
MGEPQPSNGLFEDVQYVVIQCPKLLDEEHAFVEVGFPFVLKFE